MNALTMPITDGWTIARRNTLKIRRSPDLLGSAIMFPIVFVLMFAYVFGSVIDVRGCRIGSSCSPASSSKP